MEKTLSDVRSPGSQGVSRGKSESEKVSHPLTGGSNGGGSASGGSVAAPVNQGGTKGAKNPIR